MKKYFSYQVSVISKHLPVICFQYLVFTVYCLLLTVNCSAQYKQGLNYYNSFQYTKAIPYLKKAANKNGATKADASVKLADCYRYIKDYKNAEVYYQKAIEQGNAEPIVHYNYGTVLKNNNKYNEASKELSLFLTANPNDAKAKNAIKSFNDIKAWQSLPKEYTITNLDKINSKSSEFCPTVNDHKLFYTSWEVSDLVNYEKLDFDGTTYLNIYYNEIIDSINFSHKKSFSKEINTQYHDESVNFSKQNQLYITRVSPLKHPKDKAFVNRPQLYVALKKGKTWLKPEAFQYNNPDYSIAHASISNDGNYLFFSSDMPGGFGGMDIWFCKKDSTGWNKPINAGSDVNTSGNEEFPFIRKDGMLFFSSDGLPGFGGLDIFSAKQIADKWILNRNEGVGINSLADDFGVFFIDNNQGYISSNRDGGKGGDDIYHFRFTQKLITVDGTVLNSKITSDVAKDVKVLLEDSQGNKIADTRTNQDGYFKFNNLSTDNKYMVKVDETDAAFNQQKRFFYVDSKGEVMRVTVVNDKGEKYVFRNLPSQEGSLPELTSPDDENLAGNLLYGENPSLPIANKKVLLKDENGNIVDEATTNAFGAFVFNKIPSNQNYVVTLAENDASIPLGSKIIMTNKDGKRVKVLKTDGNNFFAFSLLASDKTAINDLRVEDTDLLMHVNGKILGPDKMPLKKVKVFLLNGQVVLLDSSVTNDEGVFKFDKLKSGDGYIFNVDENDAQIKGLEKIYITDLNGQTIRELIRVKSGFSFNILPSDKSNLKDVYVDDDVSLAGTLLSGENPAKPIANKKVVLKDEKGNIVDEATTNEYGAFVFNKISSNEHYIITLIEDDVTMPPGSKISINNKNGKQISTTQADDKGAFSFNLLNTDNNSMRNLLLEDADLLMDITGKIFNADKAPLKQVKVFLRNGKAVVLDTSVTNNEGVFKFNKLKFASDYMIDVDENDAQLQSLEKIIITDLNGQTIRELVRLKTGFTFNLLQSEKSTLKDVYLEDSRIDLATQNPKKTSPAKNKNTVEKDTKKNAKSNEVNSKTDSNNSTALVSNQTTSYDSIENIYYAINQFTFATAAQSTLNKVIELMKNNKNTHILISSHADSKGNKDKNLILSQKRAMYVANYLVGKGINIKRIKTIGYGETKPVNNCPKEVSCNPEEYARNRRTEFQVIDSNTK